MIFHGAFSAPGDDNDVLDPGGDCFFNAVLNDGLVDQSQHFLRNYLGSREETCAQAARGKDDFPYLLAHHISSKTLKAAGKSNADQSFIFDRPLTVRLWPFRVIGQRHFQSAGESSPRRASRMILIGGKPWLRNSS